MTRVMQALLYYVGKHPSQTSTEITSYMSKHETSLSWAVKTFDEALLDGLVDGDVEPFRSGFRLVKVALTARGFVKLNQATQARMAGNS